MNRVRGKSLKLLSLILLLVFSFSIVNVSFASSTTLFVDPPELRDETKQAGSTFTVKINVSDVSGLYGWQVNMSWNPLIVNATTVTEGEFLKGPFLWDSHPYDSETKPYWEQTKTPGSNLTITPGWTPKGLAIPPPTMVDVVENDDKLYANSTTPDAEEEWGDFGFITGNMTTVARVKVGVLAKVYEDNITEQDNIEIEVTNDGGSTWGTTHTVDLYESEIMWWVDVTSDFAWIPEMLTDANFSVRMRYKQEGVNASRIEVDHFPVRVADTLVVVSPAGAHDKSNVTYASFRYSQTDGNFTVFDFSHDFPSDATGPSEEHSEIVQVDFNMRYNTTASTGGDKYKIAYYVDPNSTEIVLADWNSTGTPLDTYTWPNQTEPNGPLFPGDPEWDWYDVSNIRIVVETNRTGGDVNAVFREYEAWVTVTYLRPTTMNKNMDHWMEGWALFSTSTDYKYPGISGNGSLASVEFDVLAYGETVLNISDPDRTYLTYPPPPTPPEKIPCTRQNGYFSNIMPGDFDGDGDVDPDDFSVFAGAYGSSEGEPSYDSRCDFDGDGDVDPDDFSVFAGNYGWP